MNFQPPPEDAFERAVPLQGLFESGNTLLRAIVASEVLGPPRALRENYLWSLQQNDPST